MRHIVSIIELIGQHMAAFVVFITAMPITN
jgi:hypothetical protein